MTQTLERPPATARRAVGLVGGLVVVAGVLAVVTVLSVALGSRDLSPAAVLGVLISGDGTGDASVIREMRLPRTLLAILVGAGLAVGGTILQGVARNPLADPGVLGINAGAALAVVTGSFVLGFMPASGQVWLAFVGAGVATLLVYSIASVGRVGATPVKLALAGAALTAFCVSATSAIILSNPDSLNQLRMWQVGALGGRYFPVLIELAPYFIVGIAVALFSGRALNLLSLGDEVAAALGLRVRMTRVMLFGLVVVLCGAATAACGPIVFVGLMVPHLARLVCGPDYRWILAYSALLGPVLVVACDILGRIILPAGEAPVGIVVGLLGAPVFVAIVRARRSEEL